MESVGFTRAQAEAMAEEQAKLIDERLATKADLAELRADLTREISAVRTDLTREIEAVRTDLRGDIELLRRDLVIRLGGIIIASIAAASTLTTLFSRARGG